MYSKHGKSPRLKHKLEYLCARFDEVIKGRSDEVVLSAFTEINPSLHHLMTSLLHEKYS